MDTSKSLKERLGVWGIGFTANTLIDYAFELVLYPFVINELGLFKGGAVMIFASFLVCLMTIIFYDWARKDWIGIETLKEVEDIENSSMFNKFVKKMHHKYEWVLFIIFSLKTDPFITTIFMRKGAHKYNGLSQRDWVVFIGSLILGNIFWTGLCFFGLEKARAHGFNIEQILLTIFVVIILFYVIGLFKKTKSEDKSLQ